MDRARTVSPAGLKPCATAETGGPNRVRPTLILVAAALVVGAAMVGAGTQTFYRDDPLTREVEDQDASRVRPVEIGHGSSAWQRIRGIGDRTWRRAMNVNSIDEVPDSSWFTNRISSRRLSVAEIAQGPDTLPGPAAGGWIVLGGKSDGVTPGLQLQDSAGHRFFVKFDPPANPEMASGAEVISTKLLFALGYRVPENYIATVRREDLAIGIGGLLQGSRRQKAADDGRRRRSGAPTGGSTA